jgi:hypothetical protein
MLLKQLNSLIVDSDILVDGRPQNHIISQSRQDNMRTCHSDWNYIGSIQYSDIYESLK